MGVKHRSQPTSMPEQREGEGEHFNRAGSKPKVEAGGREEKKRGGVGGPIEGEKREQGGRHGFRRLNHLRPRKIGDTPRNSDSKESNGVLKNSRL